MNFRLLFILTLGALALISCGSGKKGDEQKLRREGKGFIRGGQTDRGIAALKRAFNINSNNEDTAVTLAQAFLTKGDSRNASLALSTYLSKNSGKPETWYLLGLARYQERKSDAAIESLDEALKLKRAYPEAILLLGKIYEEHKETVAAKEAYLSIASEMSLGKALMPVLVRLAAILLKSENERDRLNAAVHLQTAISLDPDSREAHSLLGLFYLKDKKPKKAIAIFESWLKINPKDGLANLHLGQALLMDAQYEKALAQYEKAAALRTSDTLPLMGIVETATYLKKPKKIYDALVKASTLTPSDTDIIWRLIPFYLERELYSVALRRIISLQKSHGSKPEYYKYLTDIYFNMGEYSGAYESWMKLLTLGQTADTTFKRRAGILARQCGHYDFAAEYLRPLLALNPDDREVKLNLALALWHHEVRDKKLEGLKMLEEMAKGDWVIPLVWWAWYKIQDEKLPEAFAVLKRAETLLKKDPVDRLFYFDVMSQYYLAAKDLKNHILFLEKEIPLAQNDSERRSLKIGLAEAKKTLKSQSVPAKPALTGPAVPGPRAPMGFVPARPPAPGSMTTPTK
ncbi:tetratricopeptide repeat protein [Myxococcota bacterium]|nr:tetratricopeptide repeat protein [Myxococcota bacterium]